MEKLTAELYFRGTDEYEEIMTKLKKYMEMATENRGILKVLLRMHEEKPRKFLSALNILIRNSDPNYRFNV